MKSTNKLLWVFIFLFLEILAWNYRTCQVFAEKDNFLKASVSYHVPMIFISNLDDFPWENCVLQLNPDSRESSYFFMIDRLDFRPFNQRQVMMGEVYNAGKVKEIDSSQFVTKSGLKFDPNTMKPLTMLISCHIPNGELSWSGDVT